MSGGSKITGDGKITDEGEKTIEHLAKEKINAVLSRKDITGEEMNRRLQEELDACTPPSPEFDKFVPGEDEEEDMDEDEEEDMDEDEEEYEDSDEDDEMDEEQLAREIKEAKKGIQRWFTKEDPLLYLRYVFKHLDQERIKAMCTRKGITREEENKIFEEINTNIDKFLTTKNQKENMDSEEDKGMDDVEEDGEMRKAVQLGDEEKPGIMKRPQSSLLESE